jgi:acetyltransferase-like isoleucine patch superfamily enzyme
LFHLNAVIKLWLYKAIYGKRIVVGKSITFRKGFYMAVEKGGKIEIGDSCFFNHYCSFVSFNSIVIGEGSIFGEGVKIYDHNHCYTDKKIPIKKQGYTSSPVVIGKNCWLASYVIVLKGVTIGDNCVIGAGCVITKDIPANSIVVNKQTHIRKMI